MDNSLYQEIQDRVRRSGLEPEVAERVLAACGGPTEQAPSREATADAEADTSGGEPTGPNAWLHAVEVQAFRGIGQRTRIEFSPGPGLTVVSGRNGSGKSSFAEGLEFLLTGELERWEGRTKVWKGGWHNLHSPLPAEVAAEFVLDGRGLVRLEREVQEAADGGPTGGDTPTVTVLGGDDPSGAPLPTPDELGWDGSATTHRPFLAHSEVETLLGSPSGLYAVLARVLGLDDLARAAEGLRQQRLERDKQHKQVLHELDSLRPLLDELEGDPRAATCRAALPTKRLGTWNLDAVETTAAGTHGDAVDAELRRLRDLAQLTVATPAAVADAAAELTTAAVAWEASGTGHAHRALRLAALLQTALDHHHDHGDGPCPVCGRTAALDAVWRSATETEVARLKEEARALASAEDLTTQATRTARALTPDPPAVLSSGEALDRIDLAAAREAWTAWAASLPETTPALHTEASEAGEPGPEALLEATTRWQEGHDRLVEVLAKLNRQAAEELEARDDRWAPVATRLAAWVAPAREVVDSIQEGRAVKAAEGWLREAEHDIRNERFAPFAERSQQIWQALRQQSNVSLTGINLAGKAQKLVELDVTVDGRGTDAEGGGVSALGVMSQGELNALALSVFLPRATVADSPFRFVVIDDPVQAMDPAKVEGLARSLAEVARERQVIVFTHDDRLPLAVRELQLEATLLTVNRRTQSQVTVVRNLDPVIRALQDAEALCKDQKLPDAVRRQVVGPLCRTAVEARFTEVARRSLLARGKRHIEVEGALVDAVTVKHRAALAMFGDPRRADEVYSELRRWSVRHSQVLGALNKVAHTPVPENMTPATLVAETQRLVDEIERRLS